MAIPIVKDGLREIPSAREKQIGDKRASGSSVPTQIFQALSQLTDDQKVTRKADVKRDWVHRTRLLRIFEIFR
jgi:hypothetical protein